MSLATATDAVTTWMAGRIAAGFAAAVPAITGIPVYVAAAPWDVPRPVRNASAPYITLRHLGSSDRLVVGGTLIASVTRIEVTAWEEGTDTTRIKAAIVAAHGALHGQRGGVVDGMVISGCVRDAAVERQIDEGDYLYTQLGGEYVVRLSAAS